jgi:hypothetical protein
LVAGLAGVLFAARLGSVRGNLAEGFELDIITMVLLGGVSIFGGSGNLVGVALSILIILNLRSGLGLANIQATTQDGDHRGAADRLGAGPQPRRSLRTLAAPVRSHGDTAARLGRHQSRGGEARGDRPQPHRTPLRPATARRKE